jgi:hypothetical protein
MATEPLRFPNLVTGFERNPAHAARTALYTRYTPYEWMQSNISHYNEADTNRNFSERLRGDAIRVIRQVTCKAWLFQNFCKYVLATFLLQLYDINIENSDVS